MYPNIYNWTKTFAGKILAFLAGIVVVMAFIDYLLKWQIYSYIFNIAMTLFRMFYQFAFEFIVLIWLGILTFFFWKLRIRFIASKPNALEKYVVDTRTSLENNLKKNIGDLTVQIKGGERRLSERLFDVERTIIDFEIEGYKKKKQIGALAGMLKKLDMDRQRDWGVEDTLFEIKEYIKDSGMPNLYLADLNKALANCSDDLKILKDEILKLAQEKLYRVNG